MQLDTLGFIDYIVMLSALVVIFMLLPFFIFCCDCNGRKFYLWSSLEPIFVRMVFVLIFVGMIQMIDIEREQCKHNQTKVQSFSSTNVAACNGWCRSPTR